MKREALLCCTGIWSWAVLNINRPHTHTHKQTQRCMLEFIQKAAQGNGPDLSFAKVTALL